MITDNRSKHAIIIDKSLRAKNRTSDYETWTQHRATMDYTGYDHPTVLKSPAKPTPKHREEKPVKTEEPLTVEQKKEARTIFLSQSHDKQVKDVQKRQNVITKKYQFYQYKANPYGTDIEGIDTPDEETEKERANVLSKMTDAPILYNSFRGGRVGGFFIDKVRVTQEQIKPEYKKIGHKNMLNKIYFNSERKPAIYLPAGFDFQTKKNDLYHELGHAFEKKVYGYTGKFGNDILQQNKSPFKNRDSNKFTILNLNSNTLLPNQKHIKTKKDATDLYTTFLSGKWANKYNYLGYRRRREEIFANSFQGFITNPRMAKKTGYAYNVITKTPLFKEYKQNNKKLALNQISRLKLFKF